MQISGLGGGASSELIQQLRERMFSKADADGNGGVSRDEFQTMAANGPAGIAGGTAGSAGSRAGSSIDAVFGRLDANGDGSLTAQELEAAPTPGAGAGTGTGGMSRDTLSMLLGLQQEGGTRSGGNASSETGAQLSRTISQLLESYGRRGGEPGSALVSGTA